MTETAQQTVQPVAQPKAKAQAEKKEEPKPKKAGRPSEKERAWMYAGGLLIQAGDYLSVIANRLALEKNKHELLRDNPAHGIEQRAYSNGFATGMATAEQILMKASQTLKVGAGFGAKKEKADGVEAKT